jgi:hypothetical protein
VWKILCNITIMVRVNIAFVFALQTIGSLAIAVPAKAESPEVAKTSDDVYNITAALLNPSNYISEDPSTFVPEGESIFEREPEPSLQVRGDLAKRDIRPDECWNINGLSSSERQTYFDNFLRLATQMSQTAGSITLPATKTYDFNYGSGNAAVHLRVRNQSTCGQQTITVREMQAHMTALWNYCSNNMGSIKNKNVVILVRPHAYSMPGYTPTCR